MGSLWSSLFGGHEATAAPVTTAAATTPAPTAAPFTPIATAAAATPWAPANPTWRALRAGVGANLCLSNGGTLATCNGSPAQGWYLDPTGLLVSQTDGTCLTAKQVQNSVPLSNAACDPSSASQQWASPGAGQLLMAGNSNLSLDVPGGNGAPGVPVSTWFKNGLPPQVWSWA